MEQRGETDIKMTAYFKKRDTYPCYHHAVQKKYTIYPLLCSIFLRIPLIHKTNSNSSLYKEMI